jgi:hypothetical protein
MANSPFSPNIGPASSVKTYSGTLIHNATMFADNPNKAYINMGDGVESVFIDVEDFNTFLGLETDTILSTEILRGFIKGGMPFIKNVDTTVGMPPFNAFIFNSQALLTPYTLLIREPQEGSGMANNGTFVSNISLFDNGGRKFYRVTFLLRTSRFANESHVKMRLPLVGYSSDNFGFKGSFDGVNLKPEDEITGAIDVKGTIYDLAFKINEKFLATGVDNLHRDSMGFPDHTFGRETIPLNGSIVNVFWSLEMGQWIVDYSTTSPVPPTITAGQGYLKVISNCQGPDIVEGHYDGTDGGKIYKKPTGAVGVAIVRGN